MKIPRFVKMLGAGCLALGAWCLVRGGAWAVVIDDTPVTGNITVESGEELAICGSGLSAAGSCTVTLAGANTIHFYTTATVAAKIVGSAAVTLQADADVTGTFTGGASFSGGVTMKTGNIRFTTKSVTSYSVLTFLGGHLTLADSCSWTVWSTNHAALLLNSDAQTEDACLELAAGGKFEIGNKANNLIVYIGRKSGLESKLLIDGGTFVGGYDGFHMNYNGSGTAIVEVKNGGVFSTRRCGIDAGGTGVSKFILGENAKYTCDYGQYSGARLALGSGNLTYSVEGHATLDISTCPAAMKDANSATSGQNVHWSCTKDGFLTIKGRADATTTLSLRNVDSGFCFGFMPYAGTLSLANPADALNLTVALSPGAASKIVSANPNCALTMDYVLTDGFYAQVPLTASAIQTEGFSSVTVDQNDVTVDAPNASVYLGRRCVGSIPGTINLTRGTMLLDTDPGEKLVQSAGTTVHVQDTNPYVMTNESMWASATKGWFDPAGTLGAWVPGAIADVKSYASNGSITGEHVAYGVRVISDGSHYWDGTDGYFALGAGGLQFNVGGKNWCMGSCNYKKRFVLMDDQVWTNTTDKTSRFHFGFSYNMPDYYTAYMTAAEGVKNWKIAGALDMCLYSPSNDLHDVTVTVAKPARLFLIGNIDARLNAGKLVLDGSDMAFGAAPDWTGEWSAGNAVNAIDAFHLAPEVQLKDGGTLTLTKVATPFAVPTLSAAGANNRIVGKNATCYMVLTQAVTTVSVPTAADELAIEVPIRDSAAACFNVRGAGTLALKATDEGLVQAVNFADDGTLKLTGTGCYRGDVTGGGALLVAGDGAVYVAGDVAVTAITVSSGTLVLRNKDAIPTGVTVTTSGAGGLMLVDPTGFDASMMGGTKNLVTASHLVVTDEPREDETIKVNDGETLQVYGSGLCASSTVVLQGGAKVCFYETATIAAAIISTNTVTFTAAAGTEGRIAGKYMAAASGTSSQTIDVTGAGVIDFAGGVSAGGYVSLRVNGGHGRVSAGTLLLYGNLTMLAGDFTFTNAVMNFEGNDHCIDLASADQWDDATVTFLKGSSMTMDNNQRVYVGKNAGVASRLVLDGGTWMCTTYDTFGLCLDNTGNGIFEMKSGTYNMCRRIQAGTAGNSRFIWTGGTLQGQWNDTNYKYTHLFEGNFAACTIAGDCRLNLHRFIKPVVSNFCNAAGRMTVMPGARLTIKSEDSTAGWCNHFVLNGLQGAPLTLKLERSTQNGDVIVDVPDYTEPVKIDWVMGSQGTVNAIGATTDLLAGYVVPSGVTFAQAAIPTDWYTGFASVTLNNLTFEAGSSYRFPITDSTVTPLNLAGTLTLPSELTYYANANVYPDKMAASDLIVPAGGIVGADCVWTCGGGVSRRRASIAVVDDVVKFACAAKFGFVFSIR